MLNFISSLLKALPFTSATATTAKTDMLEPMISNEFLAEMLNPEPQPAETKALFATQIYVDLDNVLSQLRPDVLDATLAKLHDVILALVAKFPAPVKVAIYGNLRHWKLSEQRWEWQKNLVEFIDTPATIHNEIMITDIFRQARAGSTIVLISCDAGFTPVLNDIKEHDGVRTELVLFGHASYKLKQAAFVLHSGMDILSNAGVFTTQMAKTAVLSP